jgi:hypothetical protein
VVTEVAVLVGMGSEDTPVDPPVGATGDVVVVAVAEAWQTKGAGHSASVAHVVTLGRQDPGYWVTVVQVVVDVRTVVDVAGGTAMVPPVPGTEMGSSAGSGKSTAVPVPVPTAVVVAVTTAVVVFGAKVGTVSGAAPVPVSTETEVAVPLAVPVVGFTAPPVAVPTDPVHIP